MTTSPLPCSLRKFLAIVPAAGESRRMGEPKLLLSWGSGSVLEKTVTAWRQGGVTTVVVVVRPGDVRVAEAAKSAGAEVVSPEQPPPQMKDSILCGLHYLAEHWQPTPDDAWLLAPADMPWLAPSVVQLLCAAHDPERPRILVPTYHGRRGHPVLFPWPLARAVEQLGHAEGVSLLRERFGWHAMPVEIPEVLGDLDTPEDYRRLRPGGPPAT